MKKYLFVLLLAGWGLAACSQPLQHQESLALEGWTPHKVAVLPYQIAVLNKTTNRAVSPVSGAVHRGGEIIPSARVVMDQILSTKLRNSVSFTVLDSAQAARMLDERMRSMPIRQAALETGRAMEADAVLLGFIYRMSQREGEAFGVEAPASLAIDLLMLRVDDGAEVWNNSFDQTQSSLTENLLDIGQYMGRGLYWFQVEEYAQYGMDELFANFPWQKAKPE
jgi:hypothetical protein